MSVVCTDVSCVGVWHEEGDVPGVGADRESGVCVCPGVMCVPVCARVRGRRWEKGLGPRLSPL